MLRTALELVSVFGKQCVSFIFRNLEDGLKLTRRPTGVHGFVC